MRSEVVVNIPNGLYAALEKATSKFPLKASSHPAALRLDKIVPSFQTSNSNTPVNYEKIRELFCSFSSRNLFERHVAVLEKLSRVLKNGITPTDFEHFPQLLDMIIDRIEGGGKLLLDSLPNYIFLFSYAIILPSDYTNSSKIQIEMTQVMDKLSVLLGYDNEEANEAIAKVLFKMSGGVKSKIPSSEVLNYVLPLPSIASESKDDKAKIDILSIQAHAVDQSNVVKALTEAYSKTKSISHQANILISLRRLSELPGCQEKFVADGTIELLQLILQVSESDFVVFLTVEIIWNMLTCPQKFKVAETMSTFENISVLKILFEHFCINGSRPTDKQLRNELLILCNEIASTFPESMQLFAETEFIGALSLFMMHIELSVQHPDVENIILTQDHEDYEFKKLMVNFASTLCKDETNLRLFMRNGLVTFLLIHIDLNGKHPILGHWTPHQLRNLQFQVIGFLNSILPKVFKELQESNAFPIIITFLKNLALPDDPKAVKLFNERETIGLIETCIHLVVTISEYGYTIKKSFGPQGIFDALMDVIGNTKYNSNVWRSALVACGSLCHGCKANRVLFGETEWNLKVVNLLKFESPESKEKENVLLSAIECLWGGVCGVSNNEERFFQASGIFLILNLLELGSLAVKRHSLGFLLDILENPKAVYHLIEWKSQIDFKKGIASLLIELWTQEEAIIGVPQGDFGSINNTKNPLIGLKQPQVDYATIEKIVGNEYSLAVKELSGNLRVKIYAIFYKLGFFRFQGLLSPEENIKILCISKYLDFKIGEIWTEVKKELYFDNIRPIETDRTCMEMIEVEMELKAKAVQAKQMECIIQKQQSETEAESSFFKEFHSNQTKIKSNVGKGKMILSTRKHLVAKIPFAKKE